MLATFWGMSAGGWTALAAVCALLLAVLVACVAVFQASEARRLRLEQARPYVVIFAEPSPAASWVFDLVIKNFGRTPATDIRVKFEPELRRAAARGVGERIDLPEIIHTLVPGQEWRTLWDSQIDRGETELPPHHLAKVTFRDSEGKRTFSSEFGLDWGVVARRDVVDVAGIHEAATALKAISERRSWGGPGSRPSRRQRRVQQR